jgi:hypothetical protein
MKKTAEALHYFGFDYGLLEFLQAVPNHEIFGPRISNGNNGKNYERDRKQRMGFIWQTREGQPDGHFFAAWSPP